MFIAALQHLTASRSKRSLLKLFVTNPERAFHTREVAKLGETLSAVSLPTSRRAGLLRRAEVLPVRQEVPLLCRVETDHQRNDIRRGSNWHLPMYRPPGMRKTTDGHLWDGAMKGGCGAITGLARVSLPRRAQMAALYGGDKGVKFLAPRLQAAPRGTSLCSYESARFGCGSLGCSIAFRLRRGQTRSLQMRSASR